MGAVCWLLTSVHHRTSACEWFTEGLELPQRKAGRQRHFQMLREFITEDSAAGTA